jgi:hypothetical protein
MIAAFGLLDRHAAKRTVPDIVFLFPLEKVLRTSLGFCARPAFVWVAVTSCASGRETTVAVEDYEVI